MPEIGKLDIDIAGSINSFQAVMKEFTLKKEMFNILFRGKGLEFDSYRSFSPDDDAGDIDWKASARSTQLLVKQYKEERDLKIMFIIDVGRNMVFGSQNKLKCEFAAEVISALSYLVMLSQDKVGFYLFNDKIGTHVDYAVGEKQIDLFMDILSKGSNYGGNTNINQALNYALDYLDSSTSAVVIVSDFLSIDKDSEKKLTLMASKFETIALIIKDPLDVTLPDIDGEIILQDPATGRQVVVNPKVMKKTYERNALDQKKFVEQTFINSNVDYLELSTSVPFAFNLATFFKKRAGERA